MCELEENKWQLFVLYSLGSPYTYFSQDKIDKAWVIAPNFTNLNTKVGEG